MVLKTCSVDSTMQVLSSIEDLDSCTCKFLSAFSLVRLEASIRVFVCCVSGCLLLIDKLDGIDCVKSEHTVQ